ncbi:microtubule-actin cross-linking factor 1-like [Anneissia japonica]|uniref:microtubule-actin cross-linking factor 1-like n=1 Tax=Anneissia japonica TaxID=1529436 RepID=UPI00142567C5|nr:microtubule-actin cross-linking factor 1-like [Anneissia japonica]
MSSKEKKTQSLKFGFRLPKESRKKSKKSKYKTIDRAGEDEASASSTTDRTVVYTESVTHVDDREDTASEYSQTSSIYQSGLSRSENLVVRGEKVLGQIESVTRDLDNIEAQIKDVDGKASKLKAAEVNRLIIIIETNLKTCDKNIHTLYKNVHQLHEDGYQSWERLQQRIEELQRRSTILSTFEIKSSTAKDSTLIKTQGEGMSISKKKEERKEERVIIRDEIYIFLSDCLTWVQQLKSTMSKMSFGSDVSSIKDLHHKVSMELENIRQYRANLDQCQRDRNKYSGEELRKYNKLLHQFETEYQKLLDATLQRLHLLEVLLEFSQDATRELSWLDTLGDVEAQWENTHPTIKEMEDHILNLSGDIERHRDEFQQVILRGETMINQDHPGSECIKKYLNAMKSQWAWLIDFKASVEKHLSTTRGNQDVMEKTYQDEITISIELLTWMSNAEHKLGSMQPQSEQSKLLISQLQEVKGVHADVQSHQRAIRDCADSLQLFVNMNSAFLTPEQISTLNDYVSRLIDGFDRLLNQTKVRLKHLTGALDSLKAFEHELSAFEVWFEKAVSDIGALDQSINHEKDVEKLTVSLDGISKDVGAQKARLSAISEVGNSYIASSKEYKHILRDFRDLALSRQFNRSYVEPSDPTYIRDRLNRIVADFNQLQTACAETQEHLKKIVEKHKSFRSSLNILNSWLQQAENEMARLNREPTTTDRNTVQQQIENCKIFNTDVTNHARDIDQLKDDGKSLVHSHQVMKLEVDRTLDDVVQRYDELDVSVRERIQRLRMGLDKNQHLDDLIRWLEDKEKREFEMEKGTIIMVKRKPLSERLQEYRVFEKEISDYQDVIESVLSSTSELINSAKPEERIIYQSKLDDFRRRHNNLITNLRKHGEVLQMFSSKLVDLELEVEKFEGWLLPLLQELESTDIAELDIIGMDSKLQAAAQDINRQQLQYQKILSLARELFDHPRANNTSQLSAMMMNFKHNWASLEAALATRRGQFDQRKLTEKRYENMASEVQSWLDRMQEKLDGITLKTRDEHNVDMQLQQLKLTQKEISDNEKLIEDINKLGSTLNNLLREHQVSIATRVHQKSIEVEDGLQSDWSLTRSTTSLDGSREIGETKFDKELALINRRYDALKKTILGLIEDLALIRLWLTSRDSVNSMKVTVENLLTQLTEKKPNSKDLQELSGEIGAFLIVSKEVDELGPSVVDVINSGEAFLREHHDTLSSDCYTGLQHYISELRTLYEKLKKNAADWLKNSHDVLDELEQNQQDSAMLSEQYHNAVLFLQDLLDWVRKAENNLATQDSMGNSLTALMKQLTHHREIQNDIQDHQNPVIKAIQDAQNMIQKYRLRLSKDELDNLTDLNSELSHRFNHVNGESSMRLTQLQIASQDLPKFDEEITDFGQWLATAEHTLERSLKSVNRDLPTMQHQHAQHKDFNDDILTHSADLKFIIKAGEKMLEMSKGYEASLATFRESISNFQFVSHPEPNTISDRLTSVTRRYDLLKTRSSEHLSLLNQVISLQQLFEDHCVKFYRWLKETEAALNKVSSSDAANIQQQINKLQLIQDDVVAHLQDIDQCKEYCRELGDAEPELEPAARKSTDEMVRRYNALDANIKSRSSQLHEGLVQSQSFQESCDDLLQWLDLTEAKLYKMEKGTLLIIKRAPLIENLQEVKAIEGDIESHRSSIRTFNDMADKVIKSSEPRIAKAIQTKISSVNSRFDQLTESVRRHSRIVEDFITRLEEFEKAVDQLEDWLLPVCDELDSKEMFNLDLSQIEKNVKNWVQEQSVYQNQLKRIHSMGERLVQDPKASDASYVASVLTSVSNNWRALEDLLQRRSKQIDARIRASRKYNYAYKEVGHWLDSSEYKVKQLIPAPRDLPTLHNQIQVTKKLLTEINNYKPTITDYSRYGQILDRLTQEEEVVLHSRPHFRSLQIGTTNAALSWKQKSSGNDETKLIAEVDSAIQKQVGIVEQRYAALISHLNDHDALLHIIEMYLERKLNLTDLLNWVSDIDSRVNLSAPSSLDLNMLHKEFESYKGIHGDVEAKKAAILDSVHGAEQFLSDKRHQLTSEQIDDLQKLIADLRHQYDLLSRRSGDIYKKTEDTLSSLRLNHDERIRLQEQYDSLNQKVRDILDWITHAENQLASGQPLAEQLRPLSDQLSQHKTLNESIKEHQEEVLEVCQVVQHFLKLPLDSFNIKDIENLQKDATSLRSRYNNLNSHSNSRLTKLQQALHDLEKVVAEMEEFESWMSQATGILERSVTNIGVDSDQVRHQCEKQKEFAEDVFSQAANLKFITLAGSNFVAFSKEYLEALAEFRDCTPIRQFSLSSSHIPDSNIISDRLSDLNNRYKQLKGECQDHTMLITKISDRMEKYQSSSEFMLEWLDEMTELVKKLVKEDVSGEPSHLQEQIDRVKDANDTILLHGREVNRLKESGRDLCDVHDDVKKSVQTHLDNVSKRYKELLTQLSEYKMKLTSSLSGNIGLRERLENLLRQILDAEHIFARLGQIPIILKKEPLTNILQEYVNLKNQLETLQSVVSNINRDVTSVVQSGKSSTLHNIQAKLDDMNSRYSRLLSPIVDKCKFVQALLEKVNLLQREADEVEDWVLPELEMLQSADINRKELSELQSILQKTAIGLDRYAPQYQKVVSIADELLTEKDVADSSSVVELQESMHDNWSGLKETLSSRRVLVEERIEAMRLYNLLLKEVSPWLASMERKQAQLGSVAIELNDIQAQLSIVKPFRNEVVDYQGKISKLNAAGAKVDELMHDVPSMMGKSFRRSSLLITSLPMFDRFGSLFALKTSGETAGYLEEESEVQLQLSDINKRYKSLSVALEDRENELELNLEAARVLHPVDQFINWTIKTQAKLSSPKQLSSDISSAHADLEQLLSLHQEILGQQSAVHQSCDRANKLLHDNREHFNQEQYDVVNERSGDLKTKYNELLVAFNHSKRSMEENILKLRILEDERVLIQGRLKEAQMSLSQLVDWISQMEKKLGTQQPMAEQLRPLRSQIDRHSALNGEIVSRRPSIVQTLEDVNLLLRQYGDKISHEDVSQLRSDNDNLMQRYEVIGSQSLTRLNHLTAGLDDLQRYQEEFDDFLEWLKTTEDFLEKLQRGMGRDLQNLQRQLQDMDSLMEQISDRKGDLKFLKRASQRYFDIAKTFRDALSEYRRLISTEHSFMEISESRQIQDELSDVYERYTSLKSSFHRHIKLLKDIISKHQKYAESCNGVLPWIHDAYNNVSSFIKEPLETEPEGLARQMDQVKTLIHDLVLHTKDIETLKDSGKNLASAQPEIRDNVMKTVDDVSERYAWMEAQLSLRRGELERNLGLSRSVLDELDRLLEWLEVTEKKAAKVVNTAVVVKKDHIYDLVQQLKFYETDIDSHRPPYEKVKESGRLHIQKSDHQAAQKVRGKLDSLTTRFTRLEGNVANHSEFLQKLLVKLDNLYSDVAKFEDWMAPVIGVLESHDLNHMSLLDLGLKLMQITWLQDGIIYVMVYSYLSVRPLNQQLEEKEAAYKRFNESVKLCSDWLDRMEERVSHLDLVAVDTDILKKQLDQFMPLHREHNNFSSAVDEMSRFGKAIETLSEEQERMVRLSAQFRNQQTEMRTVGGFAESGGRRRRPSIGSELEFSAFVQDEGLSDIQRQILDIQDRYQLLGEKLTDRKYEITTTQKTVQQYQMELSEFINWMKKTAQLLKDEVVTVATVEQAQKALDKHEALQKDVNDHYKYMQSIIELAQELTPKKNEHPAGYDKINSQMKNMEEQWNELQKSLKLQGTDIHGIIEALHHFEDSWRQLKLWLEETEMIMTVLGPIGIAPDILKNQRHQTKVYQKHFPSHEYLLDNLKKSSQALISRFASRSRTSSPMQEKVNDITRLWTDLYHRLEDRHDNINGVLQNSEKFHGSLKDFSDWLNQFGNVVKSLAPIGGSNEVIKKQMEETIALQRDAAHMNPQILALFTSQSQLLDLNPEATSKVELSLKMDSVQIPFEEYKRRLDERFARLESALSEAGHLDDSIATMIKWLESKEHYFSVAKPISAIQDNLRSQIANHQELSKELVKQAYSYDRLMDQIESQINKLKYGAEHDKLTALHDDLKRRWEGVNHKASEIDLRLKDCDRSCQAFLMDNYRFAQWLRSAEDRQVDVGALVLRVDVIRRQQDILKQIEADIASHNNDFESTNASANNLLEVSDVDQQYIKDDLVDMTTRWKDMKQDVFELMQLFNNLSSTLKDFEDRYVNVIQAIERWEYKLSSRAITGKDIKHVHEDIKSLGDEVTAIQHLMNSLISKAPSRIDSADVKKNVEIMKKRYDALKATVLERQKLFETGRHEMSSFQQILNEIHSKLASHEDVIDQHTRAQDVTTLLKQIEEVKQIYSSLEGVKGLLDQATRTFRVIYDKGFLSDPESSREQLDLLSKRFYRLNEQITLRLDDSQKIMVKHGQFQDVAELILEKLRAAEHQLQSQKPVGNDLEVLKSQQHEIQVFIKSYVDPLVERIKDLNHLGQSLLALCVAAKVNSQTLQVQMKTITDRWKILNSKLSEREVMLNEGLLRCGKFQDAYQSIFNWIKDTEQLVSAQKNPPSDHRVIKAHLQEQLLLDRLITDRKASVQALRTMGEQLANISEPSDRVQISRKLDELEKRWTALQEVVQTRRSNLEVLELSTRGQVHEREVETIERRVGQNSTTIERNSMVGQSSRFTSENGIRDTPRYSRLDGSLRRVDLDSRSEQSQQQFGRFSRRDVEQQNGR